MSDLLASAYLWVRALHIIAVISWMAGLLYLPRLFVNHVERAPVGSETSEVFKGMEYRLLKYIMNPAMITVWLLGLLLAVTPGVVDWSSGYAYVKLAMILGMTIFHQWLGKRRKDFDQDKNTLSSKTYRIANEIPTLMMIVIVIMIVVRPF